MNKISQKVCNRIFLIGASQANYMFIQVAFDGADRCCISGGRNAAPQVASITDTTHRYDKRSLVLPKILTPVDNDLRSPSDTSKVHCIYRSTFSLVLKLVLQCIGVNACLFSALKNARYVELPRFTLSKVPDALAARVQAQVF